MIKVVYCNFYLRFLFYEGSYTIEVRCPELSFSKKKIPALMFDTKCKEIFIIFYNAVKRILCFCTV